ncbi:phospholipid carrier-dependent glycosyltransferase [Robertkochia marina]|uniref:Phospholipid carrier-dependent glycosyltransferase n=1 Tax=Robertkochia marina TaxID=1227945 RepID=A0A4V3UXV1_9FLAO|nr:glycosyltransferase family 39 protein [Robertkochia marina]THD65770.1 phospholipid carrier-dependent glycosyltransferase [Robertkochia marina]TRZ46546.1 phospholipid carrier-dependent glycosyltransferase [Robertkochia marina]
MIKLLEKYPLQSLLVVSGLIFLVNLDVIYVNIMEARNFVTAREMLTENNWILTTMNDYPRYAKPPLPTWLTAFSAGVFGVHNLFGLRLTAALSAIMLAYFVYNIALLIRSNTRFALYSGLILITSFYIVFAGRNGQWDIYTHSFMAGAIYFSLKLFLEKNRVFIYALAASLFFAASILSKGPVSLYALWLPFLLAVLVVYRKDIPAKKWKPFIGLLISGIVIGVSWYVYVRIADPVTFVKITSKETANWSSYNVRPFWYYWSFFTQSGMWTLPAFIALLYPYMKNRVQDLKSYRFTLFWTLFSVILLSVIPEKKSRYLLPVLIPMAINTAFYIEYLVESFKNSATVKEKLPVYLHFGLLALIGLAFPIGGYWMFGDKLKGYEGWFAAASLLLFILGTGFVYYVYKRELKQLFYLSILLIAAIVCFVLPLSHMLYSNPQFNNINTYEQKAEIRYSYGEPAPEMIWHLGHTAPDITKMENGPDAQGKDFTVLVGPELEDEFKRIFAEEYSMELLETFDINYTASPGDSNYKDRLVSKYYLLKKK